MHHCQTARSHPPRPCSPRLWTSLVFLRDRGERVHVLHAEDRVSRVGVDPTHGDGHVRVLAERERERKRNCCHSRGVLPPPQKKQVSTTAGMVFFSLTQASGGTPCRRTASGSRCPSRRWRRPATTATPRRRSGGSWSGTRSTREGARRPPRPCPRGRCSWLCADRPVGCTLEKQKEIGNSHQV